jgi:UDP:flavonoid glycosyltransferase YjiC (YdhE family)
MAKYLAAATPMPGHADPVIAAAAGLVARGHEVVIHTGSLFRAAVQRAGARFVPLASEIDIDYRDIDARFPERAALPPGPAQMLWGIQHLFADSLKAQHQGLCDIMRGFPADAILADMLFLGTLPLLLGPAEARPRIAHLGISSLGLSGPETAFYGAGLPPARTDQQRARNQSVNRYMQNHVFAGVQAYINNALKASGAPKLQAFISDAVITLPDVYFQLGVAALEYKRPLPSNIRFIGALPAPVQNFVPPPWWDEIAQARAAGRKIVLITQGTIASADLDQLVIPALRALTSSDALVIAITSGADPQPVLAMAPANARMVPFIPYAAIFPHLDLLITNGGFGGVLLALQHGVPLLVAGDSEEKPEIAARIAHAGVGINAATGRPDAALLAAAIAEIFVDPGYHARALMMKKQLREVDAIGAIEAALAEQPAPAQAVA